MDRQGTDARAHPFLVRYPFDAVSDRAVKPLRAPHRPVAVMLAAVTPPRGHPPAAPWGAGEPRW